VVSLQTKESLSEIGSTKMLALKREFAIEKYMRENKEFGIEYLAGILKYKSEWYTEKTNLNPYWPD
jgi:hypothetical protein